MYRLIIFIFFLSLISETSSAFEASSFTLDNGLEVIFVPNQQSKNVSIKVIINAGDTDEKNADRGAAHVLEHALFRHSDFSEDMDYVQEVIKRGGETNAETAVSYTSYYTDINPKHLDFVLHRYSKFFVHRTLSNDEIRKSITEASIELGEPSIFSQVLGTPLKTFFDNKIFDVPSDWDLEYKGNHEYKSYSYEEARIKTPTLTFKAVKEFYEKYYLPNNSKIIIGGNFKTDKAKAMINRYFNPWTPGAIIRKQLSFNKYIRNKVRYKSSVSNGSPEIWYSLYLDDHSYNDFLSLIVFLEYIQGESIKNIRNITGKSYSPGTTNDIVEGKGEYSFYLDTDRDSFNFVSEIISSYFSSALDGEIISETEFNSTISQIAKRLETTENSSKYMVKFGESFSLLKRSFSVNYSNKDYKNLDYLTFVSSIKQQIIPGNLTIHYSYPSLFFPEDTLLFILLFEAISYLLIIRKLKKPFKHSGIRLVRKFGRFYFIPELVAISVTALGFKPLIYLIDTSIQYVNWPLVQYYLHYTSNAFFGIYLISTFMGILNLVPSKIIICDGELIIKYMSFRSKRYNLNNIESTGVIPLFSTRLLNIFKIHNKSYFGWTFPRSNLIEITLKNDRKIYLGMKCARQVECEIKSLLVEHNSSLKNPQKLEKAM